MQLKGKVAIVTGASAGIGRAYALALAGAGATVVAAARTMGATEGPPARNTLREVVKTGEGLPGRIYAQACDVASETDVARAVDQTISNFGRIDVLVNNAGLMKSHDFLEVSTEEWDRMMHINALGPYLTIRFTAPHMIRQRSGSIINITSKAATFMPRGDGRLSGTLAYAMSKAALNRLSFFAAEELRAHGIAVNALSPGIVQSDTMLAARPDPKDRALGKPCTPEVMGPALIYLAQQTAETLTGQVLHTDEFQKTWPQTGPEPR